MLLMDGCAEYGSIPGDGLHPEDTGIRNTESKCNGNDAMSLNKEGIEKLSNGRGFSSDVAVQVALRSALDGEFTFTCLWDSPGSALLQCNIIDGWVVGVSEIPLESSGPPARDPSPADYEPPTKIRLKKEELTVNRKPQHQEANKRSFLATSEGSVHAMSADQKSKGIERTFGTRKAIAAKTKSVQVNLPINPICESLRLSGSVNRSLLEDCSGFHGYASITSGIDWKLVSLCGIREAVFDRYLFKANQTTPWRMDNKTALLIFLTKLKLGLSFSNLAIFFGSDIATLSQMFDDILDKIHRRSEKDIVWPSGLIHKELPSYFQGLYKESRVILICLEMEVEQPKDEQNRCDLFSSTSRIYSYKVVIGMTPVGRICYRSKAYEGRKSFKRILKDCGFLSKLNSKELVLTRCITPEMEFMVKKGVLLVAPQPSSGSSTGDDIEREIRLHIERCEKRMKFFKMLNKIPLAHSSKIDGLMHVCCCLISELPPLLRYDQSEDEEF